MTRRYLIQHAYPDDAREALTRIWTSNFHLDADASAKFRWGYLEAPTPPEQVLLLAAGSRSTEVGSIGVMARDLSIDGRLGRAGLLADLAVDPEHRTALPAIRLVREARRYARERSEVSYGFPNPKSIAVFRRCGYRLLGRMTRHARVLEHREPLRRALEGELFPRVLGPIADVAVGIRRAGPLAGALAQYRLDWLDDADERFDDLWERASVHYRVVARRTAAFVRWRLLAQPGHPCRLAALSSRRTGELRAYAAVDFQDRIAHLRDFFGAPQDLAPLFELVSRASRRVGARSVSVSYLGEPRPVAALAAAGFRPRQSERAVVVDDDVSAPLSDPSEWFATDADEDS